MAISGLVHRPSRLLAPGLILILAVGAGAEGPSDANPVPAERRPLVTTMFTADPSAHVFEGKIYLYPSHDVKSSVPDDGFGAHYDMKDYHVFSLDGFDDPAVDLGKALGVEDVPWASRQMWAPDAAFKDGKYFLFFPAKDKDGIFRIGVAEGSSPGGPFAARPSPIEGSFSIDPCAFVDDDGAAYLYFGGLSGGQLERWTTGAYVAGSAAPKGTKPALGPRVARLDDDFLAFREPAAELVVLNPDGSPVRANQRDRRFFEAPWVHKHGGKYYLSYSTGEMHLIVYAVGDGPLGPFTYQGVILRPVVGWTTHHSIVEYEGAWYLFYHDASLSGGRDNLRCVKYVKLDVDADGRIGEVVP